MPQRQLTQALCSRIYRSNFFKEDSQAFKSYENRARQIVIFYQKILSDKHPQLFAVWKALLPEDPMGFELIYYFLESKEFKNSKDLKTSNIDQSPAEAFETYVGRIFKGKNLTASVGDRKDPDFFHVHCYDVTFGEKRGPHAKAQKLSVMNKAELKSFVQNYHDSNHKHSVLIHASSGADLFDHLFQSVWLGKRLPLELAGLDF